MLTALALLVISAGAQTELIYYDPDGNQQAIVSIAAGFNDYLSRKQIPLTFQPIQRKQDLDAALAKNTAAFAILSSPMLAEWRGKKPKTLLLQDAGGDTHYRKKLVDDKSGSADKFAAKTVAASMADSTQDATQRVVVEIRGLGVNVPNLIVIPVVKDVDALFALGFGQVQGALVTEASIEVMKRVNPIVAKKLRVVAETTRILRAPLCSLPGAPDGLDAKLIAALLQMAADEEGRKAIKAMGFDKWVAP